MLSRPVGFTRGHAGAAWPRKHGPPHPDTSRKPFAHPLFVLRARSAAGPPGSPFAEVQPLVGGDHASDVKMPLDPVTARPTPLAGPFPPPPPLPDSPPHPPPARRPPP